MSNYINCHFFYENILKSSVFETTPTLSKCIWIWFSHSKYIKEKNREGLGFVHTYKILSDPNYSMIFYMYWITIRLIFLGNKPREWDHLHVFLLNPSLPVSKSDCSFSKIKIIKIELWCFRNFRFSILPHFVQKATNSLQTLSWPPIPLGLWGAESITAAYTVFTIWD